MGVVVALGLNWFGDSLDGTLARVRRQERPRFGFYVDHVIDIAGVSLLLVGIALSGSIGNTCNGVASGLHVCPSDAR